MADVKNFEKLRPCGGLEKFSTSRHNINFYNNVGATAAYSNPSSPHSLQSTVFAALRILVNTHPILSAIPVDEDKKSPYFARLPSVDLRTCTQIIERKTAFFPTEAGEEDEELDAILEQQHNSHWRDNLGTRPFWNIVVLHSRGASREFTVSWIFHHALADGTSGLVFHRSFLAALNSQSTDATLEDDPIVKSPTTELLPSLERLHKLPLNWSFLAKVQWRDWFPNRHPKLWTGAKITSDLSMRTTKVRSLVLSKEKSTALLELSREHRTTLTGTLQCIAASAVLANLDPSKHDRMRVDGAVSLRRFLSLPDRDIEDQIGAWVSQYFYTHVRPAPSTPPQHPAKEEGAPNEPSTTTALGLFSWSEAQNVREAIAAELAKEGKNSMVGCIRWVPSLHSFFQAHVGRDRSESFELSNIGVFKPKPEEAKGEWKVGRVVFSQGAAVTGPGFEYSIATGGDGCLVLSFSWLEGIVQGEFMKRVIWGVGSCVDGLVAAKADQKVNGDVVAGGAVNGEAVP
ncbi:alcohol acetyltransferase [Lophiotrema nucula]|uniref:Alcohol acetyltransferase n=1 Tax=Lophiotrema nucula TaxID=690887 RepID=A0A6A5Z365_9PLEO|nr:alcohol acetyltransferase [Lophiotrema nucula]